MMTRKIAATISAILLHLAVGSVYAWSVVVAPVMEETGWSQLQVTIVFGVTLLFLGFSTLLFSDKIKKAGPQKSCAAAFVLFLTGMLISTVAVINEIYPLLVIGYGVILGIGTGIAYLTPIPVLMTWYNKYRGIAAGMVVTGFGLSSIIAAWGYHYCYSTGTTDYIFLTVGGLMSLLMLPSIFLLKPNPVVQQDTVVEEVKNKRDLFKNANFRLLWLLFFINITVGIGVLSSLSPMTQQLFAIPSFEAAEIVGIAGFVNGIARFFWSFLSDIIGRPLTTIALIACELIAVLSFFHFNNYEIYKACVYIIIACYGGMFAIMPAYVTDLFGIKKMREVFGSVLSAWGIAGFIAPITLIYFYQLFGNYSHFFYGTLVLSCINLVIVMYLAERNVTKI